MQYWLDIVDRVLQRFEGGLVGDRMVLEARLDADSPGRVDRTTWEGWRGDAAEPTWKYEISVDGGATWQLHASARFRP